MRTIIIRIIISGGLLFIILRRVNFPEMIDLIKQANINIFLTAFIFYFLFIMAANLRWYRLLLVKKVKISFFRLLAYYFIGLFYNNILPTVVGGGIVRAIYAGKISNKNKEVFSSMLTEITVGGWALILFALLVSLIWLKGNKNILLWLTILFLVATIAIILFLTKKFIRKFSPIIDKIKIFDFNKRAKEFYNSVYDYVKEGKLVIFEVIILSFFIQVAIGFMNVAIGNSLGFKIPILTYIVNSAIISALLVVPITINGLGIREWGYRFLFSQAGLTISQSVTLSLLFFFVGVIGSLIGGIIFPFVKIKKD